VREFARPRLVRTSESAEKYTLSQEGGLLLCQLLSNCFDFCKRWWQSWRVRNAKPRNRYAPLSVQGERGISTVPATTLQKRLTSPGGGVQSAIRTLRECLALEEKRSASKVCLIAFLGNQKRGRFCGVPRRPKISLSFRTLGSQMVLRFCVIWFWKLDRRVFVAGCFLVDGSTVHELRYCCRNPQILINRSRTAAVLPADAPDNPLRNTQEISTLLAESINQVRRGQLDPRVANSVGHLASILLGTLQQGPWKNA
jgi:hypothetical protein